MFVADLETIRPDCFDFGNEALSNYGGLSTYAYTVLLCLQLHHLSLHHHAFTVLIEKGKALTPSLTLLCPYSPKYRFVSISFLHTDRVANGVPSRAASL